MFIIIFHVQGCLVQKLNDSYQNSRQDLNRKHQSNLVVEITGRGKSPRVRVTYILNWKNFMVMKVKG